MSPAGGRIRRLPNRLIDQIAAGEVVERPASVVKELLENAVDAGASRIRIDVRDGGRAWIAIRDDGFGMSPEDAHLALERHATSKIASADDLAAIRSFGFRGEALPAIASVSRFRLLTRARGSEEGYEIRVEPGQEPVGRTAGAPEGTRIEVAELFGNVPARRKFLKTAATEWTHIADGLSRAALGLPGIHFEVQRDERKAIAWPACENPLDRIAAVLSDADAGALVPFERTASDRSVRGFASRPDYHRGSASGLYLFVEGRPVRDRLLRHAVLEVYRDLLPRGRFPLVLLYLSLPEGAVDVNVHPAKWEVRFSDPRGIHGLITAAIREALATRAWLRPSAAAASPPPRPSGFTGADSRAASGPTDWVLAERDAAVADAPVADATPGIANAPVATERLRFADLRCVGQLLATYLVLESKDGLILVDQHAAHERVLYEQLRTDWRERRIESQGLLAPSLVELDPARFESLAGAVASVSQLGFELEVFDERTIAVRALPALLGDRDPAQTVRNLADELQAAGEIGTELDVTPRHVAAVDAIFASLACHAARRKGDLLQPPEQASLLSALDAIPWAPTCPHGRPVAVPFEIAEIERRFARR